MRRTEIEVFYLCELRDVASYRLSRGGSYIMSWRTRMTRERNWHTYELSENVDVDVLKGRRQLEPLWMVHALDIAGDEEAADVVWKQKQKMKLETSSAR